MTKYSIIFFNFLFLTLLALKFFTIFTIIDLSTFVCLFCLYGRLPEGRKWVSHQGFCLTPGNRTNVPTSLGWVNPNTAAAEITPLQFWIQSIINIWYFECTSIWTSIIKRLWKVKKMVMVTLKLQRYFVIYIRSPLKMQKIIKQTRPSR